MKKSEAELTAAEAMLKKLGVYERVADRLVLGENISQTAQFVQTKAADIGIIALSLANAPTMRDKGRYWIVPQSDYPSIEQAGVIMNYTKQKAAAEQFRRFLISKRCREILKADGFLIPANDSSTGERHEVVPSTEPGK